MILVCPSCSARYLLSSAALGEEGRTVRCAKCDHEWFAEPDYESTEAPDSLHEDEFDEEAINNRVDAIKELLEEGEDDDDIPNSVKPIPDTFHPPAHPGDVLRQQAPLQARMAGYGAALFLFILFLAAGFVFKNSIVGAWPPAATLYEMAGFPVTFKGEGLIVETLSATLMEGDENQQSLVIKGRVINLTQDAVDVPQMQARIRSTNGESGEAWIIDPPVDEIQPGASFAFTSDYPNAPRGVGSVNLTFIPVLEGTNKKIAIN
jgi:predicted Zn finger-like uncharacterized protein